MFVSQNLHSNGGNTLQSPHIECGVLFVRGVIECHMRSNMSGSVLFSRDI